MGPIPRCPARTDRSSRGASPHALSSCHLRSGVNGAETPATRCCACPANPWGLYTCLSRFAVLAGLRLRREVHEITGNTGSFRVNFRGRGRPASRRSIFCSSSLSIVSSPIFAWRSFDLFVALVARTRVQCGLGAREELIPPFAQLGCRYAQVARDAIEALATHHTRYGCGLLLHGETTPRSRVWIGSRSARSAPTDPLVALLMLDSPFRPTVGQQSVQENPGAMDFLLCISKKKGNQ